MYMYIYNFIDIYACKHAYEVELSGYPYGITRDASMCVCISIYIYMCMHIYRSGASIHAPAKANHRGPHRRAGALRLPPGLTLACMHAYICKYR